MAVLGVPESLEWWGWWLAVAAALVGFVTLPTAFQMFGGGPRIVVEFRPSPLGELTVTVLNRMVRSRFLRLVGVHRQSAENLYVKLSVRELHGRMVAIRDLSAGERDLGANQLLEATVGVHASGGLVSEGTPLPPGRYVVQVDVGVPAYPREWHAACHLTVEPSRSYWGSPVRVRKADRARLAAPA